MVNIYIVYEISKNYNISSYPTLEKKFFGAVNLIKHIDIDQNKNSGYGIGFVKKGEFSFGSNGSGRNVIIFRANMSNSVQSNNRTKNILVLDTDFIPGLDKTTIYSEKLYSISFTKTNKNSA